jgi:hypothetical protein
VRTADAAHSAKVIVIVDNARITLDALITCEVTASARVGKICILREGQWERREKDTAK